MGALADLRNEVGVALDRASAGKSWSAHRLPIESPTPPCFLLLWGDPWLEMMNACAFRAHLNVRVVGPRLEPDAGMEMLEAMIEAACAELLVAGRPVQLVSPPLPYIINGTTFQSATLAIVHTVQVTGGH